MEILDLQLALANSSTCAKPVEKKVTEELRIIVINPVNIYKNYYPQMNQPRVKGIYQSFGGYY